MRRNARSITTSPEIVRHIAGLTEANFNLLTKLISWLNANDKAQRRFRNAVVVKLAQIEAATSMVVVGQEAQMQSKHHYYHADKLEADAKAAEEFISNQSQPAGLKMIRYIYSEDPAAEPRRDRRRKWWGWEI